MKYIKYKIFCDIIEGDIDGILDFDDDILKEEIEEILYDMAIENAQKYEGMCIETDPEEDLEKYNEEIEEFWGGVGYRYDFIDIEEYM